MNGKILKTKPIHKARVFDLVREEVVLPNGMQMELDIIRHPGASAIDNMKRAAPRCDITPGTKNNLKGGAAHGEKDSICRH